MTTAQSKPEMLPKGWGWLLGMGILLIILGMLCIAAPYVPTFAFTIVVGWLLVFGGVMQFIHAFREREWGGRIMEFLWGLLYLAAGLLLVFRPVSGALTLTLVLGIFLITEGILRSIFAFQLKPEKGWGWVLFGGILGGLLGIMILAKWPETGFWILGLFLGIHLLFQGWGMVMMWSAGKAMKDVAQQEMQEAGQA